VAGSGVSAMAIEADTSIKLSMRTKNFVPTRLYAGTTSPASIIKLAPQLLRLILPAEAHACAGNAQDRVPDMFQARSPWEYAVIDPRKMTAAPYEAHRGLEPAYAAVWSPRTLFDIGAR
jgi:hypothetical protein